MIAQDHRTAWHLPGLDEGGAERRATISHELRTPLTIIAGYVEILRGQDADRLTPKQRKMLATVDRNTAKLQRLIEDILDESLVESHAFKATRSPVSLTALADAAVTGIQPQAEAGGITVTRRYRKGLTVLGDPGQLARLVRTLLSCALGSAPRGSRVQVDAGREGAAAVLRVTGTGGGSAAGPPSDADAASMSLCRTIAANHGGELELGPSSMTVRVPLPASERLSVVG
jgi:signal transduction histidine kinase